MKNLKKIFLFAVIAGALYSCDDAYDIVQEGEYQEANAFRTISDMNLALVEIYDNISNESEIAFTSVFTDEAAIASENGGQNLEEYRHQLFATNSYASGIWAQHYAAINYINRLIAGSENIVLDENSPTFTDDQAEKSRILAEARTLRAYCTLQLLTFYSTNLKDDSALGVIISDHVPPTLPNLEELPRSTNLECFNFINADLDYADENLSNATVTTTVTKALVLGIRARMAAYRGHYTEALGFANDAIDERTTGGAAAAAQGLALASVYPDIWTDQNNNAEQILTLLRPTGKSGIVGNWFFNEANLTGGPFLDMDRNLYAELTENSRDVRQQVFIGATSLIADNYATVFDYRNEDIIVIGKYPGTPDDNLPLNNNLKPMRTVEMHFIRAEAQIAAGDLAGARTSINRVRRARNTGVTTNAQLNPAVTTPAAVDDMDISAANFDTPQEAWQVVLDERRRELCFEGHRYIDLKRLGADAGVLGIQRYERDCAPYSACDLPITDPRFTLPIPNDELNGNSVIRNQQNPGY